MDNTALNLAKDHLMFHHGNADGWITVARKDMASGMFSQYHYKPEELVNHLSKWIGEDVFFSQNTFYKPRRAVDTIRQLRSLYVDIDVYNKGFTPDWVLGKLEFEYFGQELPSPNLVIFSGRGLVLIWNIEPVPYQALPLWSAVENFFVKKLKDLGADSKASDPARIFRIAGTTNSKNGAMVTAEFRHEYRYNLRDLQHEYLPELTLSKNKPKPGRKSKILHMYNVYSLHIQRAKDIAALVEMRDGDVDGCREYICFLYRYFTCCFSDDPQHALDATLELNAEFTHPLPEQEVIRATKSAEKAWRAKSNAAANEAAKAMGYPGAGYNIKNDDLIEWLMITDAEQEFLTTIISRKEKNRRRREERHRNGAVTRETYLSQQKQQTMDKLEIMKQHINTNPKIKNIELAKIMNVSESYIRKLKKNLS